MQDADQSGTIDFDGATLRYGHGHLPSSADITLSMLCPPFPEFLGMLEYLNVFMLRPQARRVFQICDGDERYGPRDLWRTAPSAPLILPAVPLHAAESWTNHIRVDPRRHPPRPHRITLAPRQGTLDSHFAPLCLLRLMSRSLSWRCISMPSRTSLGGRRCWRMRTGCLMVRAAWVDGQGRWWRVTDARHHRPTRAAQKT